MTTSQQTLLDGDDVVEEADLTVRRRNYFRDLALDDYTTNSREKYGLGEQGPLYRHSYLYTAEYWINRGSRGESETGLIEVRARFWNRSPELTSALKEVIETAAHGAASVFNSTTETSAYAGYLDGFNASETVPHMPGGEARQHFESQEVGNSASSNAQAGKLDWNVEIYNEDDKLRGIAQGVANPWTRTDEEIEGRSPVDVAPHKWRMTYNPTKDGGNYDVHPDPRSDAKKRYSEGAGAGKTVYVNGKPIGALDQGGRTWLKPEYSGNPNKTSGGFGTYYSREGLVDETEATYQALRKGGVLYHVGEDESNVYLVTKRAQPDGYEAADSDDVAVDVQARGGTPGGTIHVLGLRKKPMLVQCRRDERVTNCLGESIPSWEHAVTERWDA